MSEQEKRERILVVDDESSVRMVLTTALRRSGDYQVFDAADGLAAQEVLQEQEVDLVITDLAMPRMDGLALMQWAQTNCPRPMWIILSGRATFEDAVRAVRLGAFDLITKPLVILDSLMVTVRNALRQRSLVEEQARLHEDIEQRNEQLNKQVVQLKDACRLLCDQARTISDDLRRAELIQRALLPRSAPAAEHYSIDAIYRPSQKVGGDLYDVARLDNRYIGAYIADAAGHGVSAAMLAVLFKHRLHLRDEQTGEPIPPADALGEANLTILDECLAPGLFVTAAYCLLDTQTNELTVASAGHPPLLLHRASGEMEMIFHTGPALGLTPGASFAQVTKKINEGDRLLLYTDGLCECCTGPSSVCDFVSGQLSDASLVGQSLLHALLDKAAEARDGASQEDDITMLLLTARKLPSQLDNGQAAPVQASAAPLAVPTRGQLLLGHSDGQAFIAVKGRGTWVQGTAFHDACQAEIEEHRPLTIDLALCDYLDSTFLGTLQEAVDHADQAGVTVRIQGLLPEVIHLLDELGMAQVLEHAAKESQPLPGRMNPVAASVENERISRQRMLEAHEALASLNDKNRDEFYRLIEGIRSEIDRYEHVSQ
jgi:serine phosphatase RsbU (regulator of sigma subunit)/anti-anti-sigma regulatory factor